MFGSEDTGSLKNLQTKLYTTIGYGDITTAHLEELVWIVKWKKKSGIVDSTSPVKLNLVDIRLKSTLLADNERMRRDILTLRGIAKEPANLA